MATVALELLGYKPQQKPNWIKPNSIATLGWGNENLNSSPRIHVGIQSKVVDGDIKILGVHRRSNLASPWTSGSLRDLVSVNQMDSDREKRPDFDLWPPHIRDLGPQILMQGKSERHLGLSFIQRYTHARLKISLAIFHVILSCYYTNKNPSLCEGKLCHAFYGF